MTIFPPWHFGRWAAVDDRVRGGSSVSHLDNVEVGGHTAARFHGTLAPAPRNSPVADDLTVDIDTLGGAGFASQRYQFGPSPLHLPRHKYDGLILHILPDSSSQEKEDPQRPSTYTLVLKSTLRVEPPREPRVPPAPEPASLSYEASFSLSASALDGARGGAGAQLRGGKGEQVQLGWSDFRPFYRGKEVKRDDPMWQPLRPEKIYELSFMCRSDFGRQKGDFGLVVLSLEGWEKSPGFLGRLWAGLAGCASAWAEWFVALWRGTKDGHIRLEDKE